MYDQKPNKDVFYVKTKDKTVFAIYDLLLSDDCDTIAYGYNFIDDNNLDKSQYEDEIHMIVKEQVEKAIRFQILEAEVELNT